eukprot:6183369-Pleurochrysis_carterae.AAC.1
MQKHPYLDYTNDRMHARASECTGACGTQASEPCSVCFVNDEYETSEELATHTIITCILARKAPSQKCTYNVK